MGGHHKHSQFGRVEKHTKDQRRLVGHSIQAHTENMRKWEKNGASKRLMLIGKSILLLFKMNENETFIL